MGPTHTHTRLPRCSHAMSNIGHPQTENKIWSTQKKVIIFFKRPFHLSNSKFLYEQRKWNRPNSISSSNATEHHTNLLLHKVIMLCEWQSPSKTTKGPMPYNDEWVGTILRLVMSPHANPHLALIMTYKWTHTHALVSTRLIK